MTGRRGRPKTTGKSHNKRANTYTSTRTNIETSMPVSKKTKSAIPLTNFFKPTSSAVNKSVNNLVDSPVNSLKNIRVDSPVHSPTDSRVNSPVNSLHGDHIAAADESKSKRKILNLMKNTLIAIYLSLIPTVLQKVNCQKMMLKKRTQLNQMTAKVNCPEKFVNMTEKR